MASVTGLPSRPPPRESVISTDTEPLLGRPGDVVQREGASSMRNLIMGTGILAQLAVFFLTADIWARLFSSDLGLLSAHPAAMSLGLFALTQAILSLQPATTPDQRRIGRRIHSGINFFSFICFTTGFVIIELHKTGSQNPHLHSVHAYLGVFTLFSLLVQYVMGLTMWLLPGLYGGEEHAKMWYVYHRYMGYLILVFVLATACSAAKTDFGKDVLGMWLWATLMLSVFVLAGVFPRIQKHKIGLGVRDGPRHGESEEDVFDSSD